MCVYMVNNKTLGNVHMCTVICLCKRLPVFSVHTCTKNKWQRCHFAWALM